MHSILQDLVVEFVWLMGLIRNVLYMLGSISVVLFGVFNNNFYYLLKLKLYLMRIM